MNKIRVMIADDHEIVRKGLSSLLELLPDLEYLGSAVNGEDAVCKAAKLAPDVILMDLKMPVMDGVTAIRQISSSSPGIKIIALTSYIEREQVQEALQAGALGYLLKNVTAHDLAEAIRAAFRGDPTLSPEATRSLIKSATAPPTPGHDITPREQEVLALLVSGDSNQDIADKLVISPNTVKNHVSSILSKLGAATRTEAVVLALEYRLVQFH